MKVAYLETLYITLIQGKVSKMAIGNSTAQLRTFGIHLSGGVAYCYFRNLPLNERNI